MPQAWIETPCRGSTPPEPVLARQVVTTALGRMGLQRQPTRAAIPHITIALPWDQAG